MLPGMNKNHKRRTKLIMDVMIDHDKAIGEFDTAEQLEEFMNEIAQAVEKAGAEFDEFQALLDAELEQKPEEDIEELFNPDEPDSLQDLVMRKMVEYEPGSVQAVQDNADDFSPEFRQRLETVVTLTNELSAGNANNGRHTPLDHGFRGQLPDEEADKLLNDLLGL